MAIIIEEDKKRSFPFALVGWLLILVMILAAAYYIFFVQPSLVIIPAPSGLNSITPIASLSIDPTSVVSSSLFESLQAPISSPSAQGPTSVGRPDPFLHY